MAGEQVTQPTNGTSSRIFNPAGGEAPARRSTVSAGDESSDHVHQPIERDPQSGRFLKPGFSSYMVSKARRLGLTDDDLADINDPSELRDLVREREFEARVSQVFDPQRVAAALKAQTGNGTNLDTPNARQPLDLGLNDEEDGPRLKELLTKLRDHYEGEIDSLRQTVDELKGRQGQREAAEANGFARQVEKAFRKHPTIFGTGSIDKLDPNGEERRFRLAAVAYHREQGGGTENLQDDIDAYVESMAAKFGNGRRKPARTRRDEPADDYGDDEQGLDDEQLGDEELDEAAEWERGVLRRPTQAGPREAPPGRDKAVQNLKRRLPATSAARDARTPRGIYLNHGSRAGNQRQR